MIDLENVDKIVERTGVTYERAKEALEKSDGDVIKAIISIEKECPKVDEQIKIKSKLILETIKEILKEGVATHIQIKKKGKSIIDLPVAVGAVSLVLAPIIGILGAGAIFVCDYEIYIEKKDGTVVDVIALTKMKISNFKNKMDQN